MWVDCARGDSAGIIFAERLRARDLSVDFVCLKHRLVVEIDGGQHNFDSHQMRDQSRDDALERAGFRTLRFWNSEVDGNLPGVLQTIDQILREAPHPAASGGHPPPAGEG